MSNISETINSIEGMPTREQAETILKQLNDWGWEGHITTPDITAEDPTDDETRFHYILHPEGVFRVVEL